MKWMHAMRARLRLLRRGDAERRMDEEIRFHLEMETANNVRAGMSPEEARRQAAIAFGGVEGHREELREGRTFGWLTGMSLDFRLGLRMLRKYPGLTVVGGVAIAFAIWVGVGAFEFISQVVRPTLPFEDGDRVVAVRTWDAAASDMEATGLHDFAAWRETVRTVEQLGAYRTVERNLITGDGRGEPMQMAEINASAFGVTRVPALLGRTLVAADEARDAPPVLVLGHEVWRRRFAADPAIVGREVQLGRERATVVGVMPEGFGFPVAHGAWAPLRLDPLALPRDGAPRVEVFGRLAPGVSRSEAQAELAALGRRAAADWPATHRHLQPRVMPYAQSILDLNLWMSLGLVSVNLFLGVLLALVCGNVALLMFARAATREAEIAVRSALGANRRRIVAQMFAEALVLAGLAGAIGLAGASWGLRWGMRVLQAEILDGNPLPFWFRGTLSPGSVAYAIVLTVVAAAIAGVLPGLKVTRGGLQGRLRQNGAGGGGARFGGVWTAIIVAQVAVTVIFPLITYGVQRDVQQAAGADPGFANEHFLSARLALDAEAALAGDTSSAARLAYRRATLAELERRLLTEPAVAGVTFASNIPRRYHDWNQIELDEGAVVPLDTIRGHRVSRAQIAPDYLESLDAAMVSGRGFGAADLLPDARAVLVNRAFVAQVLGGKNPLGRRVRYLAWDDEGAEAPETGPWYEIVGVAPDLGMTSGYGEAGIYHPMVPGDPGATWLIARLRGEPGSFGPVLQRLAAGVDPTLRLHDILPLDRVDESELQFLDFWMRMTTLLTAITLVLCWAGIYAVMSYTVSRRTREIGVRVALGGTARRVVLEILRRPLAQVSGGVALGAGTLLLLWHLLSDPGSGLSAARAAQLIGYAVGMMLVCLLACIVPTRRALRVQPTEALRAE